MKVQLSIGEAKAWFSYGIDGNGRRTTTVHLHVNDRPYCTGTAVCSLEDQFVRLIGRKLAVESLFHILVFGSDWNKEDRRVIWQALFPQFHRKADKVQVSEKVLEKEAHA